jgi:uncharacterized membrane protein (UPF0127 family)
MEIRHEPGEERDAGGRGVRVLATDVEVAESLGEQTKGLMFRDHVPEDYAMVFRFEDPPRWLPDVVGQLRSIHMLFVKVPLDVLWLRDGRVEQVATLSPWTGFGLARADTIVEMPAGAAESVEAGDLVRIVDGE